MSHPWRPGCCTRRQDLSLGVFDIKSGQQRPSARGTNASLPDSGTSASSQLQHERKLLHVADNSDHKASSGLEPQLVPMTEAELIQQLQRHGSGGPGFADNGDHDNTADDGDESLAMDHMHALLSGGYRSAPEQGDVGLSNHSVEDTVRAVLFGSSLAAASSGGPASRVPVVQVLGGSSMSDDDGDAEEDDGDHAMQT